MAASDMLSTFQKHIEDMRNLSLCKICIKPFYEPFILQCGHTYCYSCLASWFGGGENRRRKKSCPDCRAKVRTQPSPNYLLRDLVHMFIGRAELLPEDETVQEHTKAREEEAGLLAADRAGLGLFKGAFLGTEPHGPQPRNWQHGILDPEDNVMRCPDCHWELEDGGCNRCGFHEFEESHSDSGLDDASDDGLTEGLDDDSDGSIDLDDSDMDDEDDHDHEFDITINGDHHHAQILVDGQPYNYGDPTARIPTFSSDGEDSDDEDMDGFIDNEAIEGDSASDADTESTMTIHNRQFAAYEDDHVSISSDTPQQEHAAPDLGLDLHPPVQFPPPSNNDDQSDTATNYDEMTEDSDRDISALTRPARRSAATRVVLSSDDEDEDEARANPRPYVETDAEEDNEDEEDDGDDDDDDSTSDGNSDSDDDSDDDVRPPQSSNQRRQHLNVQRARRGGQASYQGYQGRGLQPLPQEYRGRANQPYNPPAPQQYPPRQQNYRGRGGTNRYQPYQRPYGRIPVGGANRGYPV